MSLHTLSHQDPPKTSSCTTFMLYSDWDRAATGKNSVASMHRGSLQQCPTLCSLVDYGLPGSSLRVGGSPGKNTGANWTILIAMPI